MEEIRTKIESREDWKIVGKFDHNFPLEDCAVSLFLEPDGSPMYRRITPSEGGESCLVRLILNKRWVDY